MKKIRLRAYPCPSAKLRRPHRIVFLTDGHNKLSGPEGEAVLALVDQCRPELVLIGGDMIVGVPNTDMTPALEFLKTLSARYPIFYANGNHEQRVFRQRDRFGSMPTQLEAAFRAFGIRHLVNETAQWEEICLCAMDPTSDCYTRGHTIDMASQLRQTFGTPDPDRFTLLLSHHPKYAKTYLDWGADLTLCGHYHGGVLRFSEHVGAITPDFTIFSPYCAGTYQKGTAKVIISPGTGDHTIPFRIHNPREVSLLELFPEEKPKSSIEK